MHKQVRSHARMGAHQCACQESGLPTHTSDSTCVSLLHACKCLYLPTWTHGNRHTQAWVQTIPQSFNKCFVQTHCVLGTVPGAGV